MSFEEDMARMAEAGYGDVSPSIPQGEYTDKKMRAKDDFTRSAMFNSFTRSFARTEKEKRVSDGLDGAVVKVGFGSDWNTWTPSWDGEPIPLPGGKKSAAVLAATGDMMGDVTRGLKQILSVEDPESMLYIDEQNQNENEQIMRDLYDDKTYQNYAFGGAVLGAVAEPVGILTLGAGKFNSVRKAIAYGAVTGGLYGAGMYVDGDESRLKNAALGGVLGGVLSGAVHGIASKMTRHVNGSKVDDMLNDVGTEGNRIPDSGEAWGNRVVGPPKPHYTLVGGNPETGFPGYRIRKPQRDKPKPKRKEELAKERALEREAKAALEGPKLSTWGKRKQLIDEFIEPIYNTIQKISPRVAHGLRKADQTHHSLHKNWVDRTNAFTEYFRASAPEVREALTKALHMGGLDKQTMKLIQQTGGKEAVAAAQEVKAVMKEVHDNLTDLGYKVGDIPDYFPQQVKDLDGLKITHADQITKAIAREEKSRGKKLTDKQKDAIVEKVVAWDPRFSNTSGGLKTRKVMETLDENIQHYHNPIDAMGYYMNTMAEDIAKRRFFRDFGHKPDAKKGLDVTGIDIIESTDSIAAHLMDEVGYEGRKQIVKLLRGRFDSDVHKAWKTTQALKNLSFAGTLGNYWSALTQLGDSVFAMSKYGIHDTVRAMIGKNISSKEDLGIVKAMAELNSEKGFTSNVADWAFKWGGFDKLDAFGKNVNINAALRSNRRMAIKDPEKFIKKWGDRYGADVVPLARELRSLKMEKHAPMSENLKLMLWSELADTQPIGLSEMPLKYLQNPNGRILYAYKTFTLKQMNYMRTLVNDPKQSKVARAANLTKFASLFIAANATVDQAKDFISGKDLDFEDKVLDNILGLLGTNKYAVDKSKGAGSVLLEAILPVPITQAVRAWDSVQSGDVSFGSVVNQLPVIGKINKEYGFIE